RGGTLLTIARPVEEQLEFTFNAKLKNVPNPGDPDSNFPRPPLVKSINQQRPFFPSATYCFSSFFFVFFVFFVVKYLLSVRKSPGFCLCLGKVLSASVPL
ncbi:MAG: hypothetical protein U9P07_08730, partial [Pseudomonadota bacterium]|nr:hypothetical protein [Pseudomonadota bacterium]